VVKTETLVVSGRYPAMILLTKTFHVQAEKKRFKKNIIAAFRLPDFTSREEKKILDLLTKRQHAEAVKMAISSKNWEIRLKFGVKIADPDDLKTLISDVYPAVAVEAIKRIEVIMKYDRLKFDKEEILDLILNHSSSEVRKMIFHTPKLNKERLLVLAKDDDFNIASKAIKILSGRGLSYLAFEIATRSSNELTRSYAIEKLTKPHKLLFLQLKDVFFRFFYLFKIFSA